MEKRVKDSADGRGLIDIEGIAAMMQVSVSTVRRLRKQAKLPPSALIGRSRRWRRRDIIQFMDGLFQ